MSETEEKTKRFVLIKLGHQFGTIGNSVGGNYSKYHPSEEPGRLDEETFDYFDTLEDAQDVALARKGVQPRAPPAHVGKKPKNIQPATNNGITKSGSLHKDQRSKDKPSREDVRDGAKNLNGDGSLYDPALDLNNDGQNDAKDESIASKVMKKSYNDIRKAAKELGINTFGLSKNKILAKIKEKEGGN